MKYRTAAWWLGLACALLSCTVLGSDLAAVRKQVQASMLISGQIDLGTDGSVQGYTLDHPEKLPKLVVDLVAKDAPHWKFKPVIVDGHAVRAKARMSLRIVAKPLDNGGAVVSITGADFGSDVPGESVSYKTQRRITYPRLARYTLASGTVYLLLQINRQGTVENAVAEQVNLGEIGSEDAMKRSRQALADATLAAARHWTFNLPTAGPSVSAQSWVVRVPVVFNLSGRVTHVAGYGQWNSYVPGPRQLVPWLDQKQLSSSTDAIPAGGIYMANDGPHLITPLNGA